NVHILVLAGRGFSHRCTVVDACVLKPLKARYIQLAIGNSSRNHERLCADFLAVGELDELGAAFDAQAADLLRGKNFHAETASLCDGAASEIGAAKAGRKAEIIFDARAHAGLTARSFALDHDRGKSFGRSVNGSREPRGSAAYDEEIIERCSCVGTQTEFCGKVGLRRIGKR